MFSYTSQRLKDVRSFQRFFSFLKVGRKRFFKNADIQHTQDGYLIQLDKKTIKTPLLNQLCIPSEPLALGVAEEWNKQTDEIKPETMPLTTICNTAIDNPTGLQKDDLISSILEFLHTDTVCALADKPDELVDFQEKHWTPIRKWFSEKYNVEVSATANLFTLSQSTNIITTMERQLQNLDRWQLSGLQSAIDTTKSLIIPLAYFEHEIDAEYAIYLSRLELEFQMERWGRFEGAHDIEKYELMSHLCASYLVYHLSKGLG